MTESSSDQALGKALLDLDASELAHLPAARQQAWRVMERDRRRVQWLAGGAILSWLLAALLIAWVLVAFGLQFPRHALSMQELARLQGQADAATSRIFEQAAQSAEFAKISMTITCAVAVLLLAALFTMLLVTASRRATLRQVNASLRELADQLQSLQNRLPSPPSGGP